MTPNPPCSITCCEAFGIRWAICSLGDKIFSVSRADAGSGEVYRPDPEIAAAFARAVSGGGYAGGFELCPGGSPFQKKVWAALREIPRGRTATYSQIARQIGSSGAARAVGAACAANPIPFFIPCHRVVPASGGVGRYAHGAAIKKVLLAAEMSACICG